MKELTFSANGTAQSVEAGQCQVVLAAPRSTVLEVEPPEIQLHAAYRWIHFADRKATPLVGTVGRRESWRGEVTRHRCDFLIALVNTTCETNEWVLSKIYVSSFISKYDSKIFLNDRY